MTGSGNPDKEWLVALHGCAMQLNVSVQVPLAHTLLPTTSVALSAGAHDTIPTEQAPDAAQLLGSQWPAPADWHLPWTAGLLLVASVLLHGCVHVAMRKRTAPEICDMAPLPAASPPINSKHGSSAMRSRCTEVHYDAPAPVAAAPSARQSSGISISLTEDVPAHDAAVHTAAEQQRSRSRLAASHLRTSVMHAGHDGAWVRGGDGGRLVRHATSNVNADSHD